MADTALIMMMMLMLFGGMGVIAYFILFQDQGAAPGQAAFEAQIMRTATAKQKAEEDKANAEGAAATSGAPGAGAETNTPKKN